MRQLLLVLLATLGGCASISERGTIAELAKREADLADVSVEAGLARAADSYRRYLEETAESPLTPDAMRRLADLQVEQAWGMMGGTRLAPPDAAKVEQSVTVAAPAPKPSGETDVQFEARASSLAGLLPAQDGVGAVDSVHPDAPESPVEAIDTYEEILSKYPHYERNDQVLYQLSRAWDEIGKPDRAVDVMTRLVREYPASKHAPEVWFRLGEYAFVRKRYLDAEDAYGAILAMGPATSWYELALYKQGWALYKQELYEEALHRFIAVLDYRHDEGFDFDELDALDEEHRVRDTFRVVSLSFSNLGGPVEIDRYFEQRGSRSYGDRIYGNLAEFYFDKLRFADAASVYDSFVQRHPFHERSPHFNMRIIEIYGAGGFPKLVVEAKKDFATRYALNADYWQHFEMDQAPEIVGFLKSNLTDLASHYHSLYQEEELAKERPENFSEARNWYGQFLASFPDEPDSPRINYRLADLLLEDEAFIASATEYERTAYDYPVHEQAAEAAYAAVYAWRQAEEAAKDSERRTMQETAVASSLRFAETFPQHDEVPVVLGAAADDLYATQRYQEAIDAARWLITDYPDIGLNLVRSAWAVIANASIDLEAYAQAELAYTRLLAVIPETDEERGAVIEGFAAAIYKQGDEAAELLDFETAANHYLRVKTSVPAASIVQTAEYDGAAALMQLGDWRRAAIVLETFRSDWPEHDLTNEVTKQLARAYREDGDLVRSAAEHERISAESDDPALARAALLTAAELYDEAQAFEEAIRVYGDYVEAWPAPVDVAMETHWRLAELFTSTGMESAWLDKLADIVRIDESLGAERTARSRYLAAKSALELAEREFTAYADVTLVQPFEKSLAHKQREMDRTMAIFEQLVDYEVAEVTAAATFYIAEIYRDFARSLMASERPGDLAAAELNEYELVLEEEAWPFEEKAIEIHERNYELLSAGIYNEWVQNSLDELGTLMPGRYAKYEISSGYLGSMDSWDYEQPVQPAPPEPVSESASTQAAVFPRVWR